VIGQLNIYGEDKVTTAIKRLKTFEPPEGYYVAFSGGKDSQVIYHLCKEAKVKFDAHYNITGIDPPELVYFIRENYPDVQRHQHEKSMFQLMEEKGLPTRLKRFCCAELKERGGAGRFVITGVRWAESARRKNSRNLVEFDMFGSQSKQAKENREIFLNSDNDEKRQMIENCSVKGKHVLNPIVDWKDSEVWSYLKSRNLEYCKLYDEGYKRLGCIGCPMSSSKREELKRYPKFAENYKRAIARWLPGYLERRKVKSEKPLFATVDEWYSWWIEK
jgi:phosphoadenosine phosphosulfate reductase